MSMKRKSMAVTIPSISKTLVYNTELKDTSDLERKKASEHYTALHWAALRGDIDALNKALWEGADINARDRRDGWTSLQLCTMRGHDSCVQLLALKGADVNTRDNYGSTPAHKAASNGHMFCLKWLVTRGVDLNAQDDNGWTPMHSASFNGHLNVVTSLLRWGAESKMQDNSGDTPAHFAVSESHTEILKSLIAVAATSVPNKSGETPIDVAKSLKRSCCVDMLAQAACEEEDRLRLSEERHPGLDPEVLLQCREYMKNEYPLHEAASAGKLKCLKVMVDMGADVNGQDDYGRVAAHRAAGNGHLHILQFLIQMDADMLILNNENCSPADTAAQYGQRQCYALLTGESFENAFDSGGNFEDCDIEDDTFFPGDAAELLENNIWFSVEVTGVSNGMACVRFKDPEDENAKHRDDEWVEIISGRLRIPGSAGSCTFGVGESNEGIGYRRRGPNRDLLLVELRDQLTKTRIRSNELEVLSNRDAESCRELNARVKELESQLILERDRREKLEASLDREYTLREQLEIELGVVDEELETLFEELLIDVARCRAWQVGIARRKEMHIRNKTRPDKGSGLTRGLLPMALSTRYSGGSANRTTNRHVESTTESTTLLTSLSVSKKSEKRRTGWIPPKVFSVETEIDMGYLDNNLRPDGRNSFLAPNSA